MNYLMMGGTSGTRNIKVNFTNNINNIIILTVSITPLSIFRGDFGGNQENLLSSNSETKVYYVNHYSKTYIHSTFSKTFNLTSML